MSTTNSHRPISHPIRRGAGAELTAALMLTTVESAAARPGWVRSQPEISGTPGGLAGIPDDHDRLGIALL